MQTSRRHFLTAAGAVSLGFLGLRRSLLLGFAEDSAKSSLQAPRNGVLKPDPEKVLDQPEGFRYSIIGRTGDVMNDGLFLPGAPDGMAAFAGSRPELAVLIRNHELVPGSIKGPWGKKFERLGKIDAAKVYDRGEGKTPGTGGTTTIVFNTKTQTVERQVLSLPGTSRNSAGSATPCRSWVTCEETVIRAGTVVDLSRIEKYQCERDHGFNFEVPATEQPRLADPVPLKAMGRFNHEAIAVNPATRIVYQTEDRDDG